MTKTVEQESFFNFFKTVELPEALEEKAGEEDEEKDLGEKMDEDFDIGNDFKDQIIPLAIEYYLAVIEQSDNEMDGDDEEEEDEEKEKVSLCVRSMNCVGTREA